MDIHDSIFHGADLSQSATGDGLDAHAVDWHGVTAEHFLAEAANFRNADLSDADLAHSSFSNDDFTNANLSGANVTGVQWEDDGPNTWNNTTCPDGTNSDNHGNTCVGH